MKNTKIILFILLNFTFTSLYAHDVIIKRNSNLRTEATTHSTSIKILKPNTEVKLINLNKKNGYYQVIHKKGIGYVWAHNVNIIQEYNRKHWKHWSDDDKDCQKTRDEVLVAESEIPVTFKGNKSCKVIAGRWTDPYSGKVFTDPKELDVDHMVPLKNAHQSGGWQWSYQNRKKYANDMEHPEHLIAVNKSLNRSKSAKGPDDWLPPDQSYHCQYVKDWENIKQRWGLTITDSERTAIDNIQCP